MFTQKYLRDNVKTDANIKKKKNAVITDMKRELLRDRMIGWVSALCCRSVDTAVYLFFIHEAGDCTVRILFVLNV